MTAHPVPPSTAPPVETARDADASDLVAPDCRGMNFFHADRDLGELLELYLAPELMAHLRPWLERLGELAGGRLDELAEVADRNPPVLRRRDRFGRDEEWIEYHPAYREMEQIGFGDFGIHAMGHRGGVLDWPEPLPPVAKYAFQYLFVQAEFGLMCPISLTDTSAHLLERFGNEAIRARFLPRMRSQDMAELWRGTQFMTEKAGGSDVGGVATRAVAEGDHWRLYGEKWFCSHTDAEVAMILARPEGAAPGSRGLGLFVMPWRLEDGRRNGYRIVRLKDKLGTRSMASGEIMLEGAHAWQVGELDAGLKQIMAQVNLSRLSHGVRAAAMMRRCLNEALQVARHRVAFDRVLMDMPLMRRQLMKLMVPAEQALSMFMHTAQVMEQANGGDAHAAKALRILTPLLKFRATRDNIGAATGSLEVRGGNGYIEDWVNPRLVRDAQVGLLWEGTSNINALDVVTRAVKKERAHEALAAALPRLLEGARAVPRSYRARLEQALHRAVTLAEHVAGDPESEPQARRAAGALYHAASSIVMAWEGARLGGAKGNGRRLLLSRCVLEHRLAPNDPLAPERAEWEAPAIALLLAQQPVPLEQALPLLGE